MTGSALSSGKVAQRWFDQVMAGLDADAAGIEALQNWLPPGYDELIDPTVAVTDIREIVRMASTGADLATTLVQRPDGSLRFRIYRRGESIPLADLLPLLDHLGFRALDERAFAFDLGDGGAVWLHDVGVAAPAGAVLDPAALKRLEAAFAAEFDGTVEVDGLNRLILTAGLGARQVEVLRAYSRYLRQIGFRFSQQYIESALVRHGRIAAMLVERFHRRLDPSWTGDRDEDEQLDEALDAVPTLDDDRTLRTITALIDATLRTNFFRPSDDGRPRPVISFKFDTRQVPDLPPPRPMFEIWVCSPRVEGIHLRNGRIARGGLRWSDRREDFRTEVLGLVKAQIVKNAVIVPTGAKGGFVVKRPPAHPDEARAEGLACYRQFICGLLDVTDNIVAGKVVPPPDVVRYDDDDPYLVVAADKGTATFSDVANEIAATYDFWLGDAFASGGSAGYDHKEIGITARGAWESVRRHARGLGLDADRDPLSIVGIGDMSGDVFGNGLLRSPYVRLLAAFDHRHIFIDPHPDPEVSFAERRRLFEMPRSSWADYDRTLVSPGGGVHPRSLKAIPVSSEARQVLGLEDDHYTPAGLISALLRAPVDVLWNGGVGTYVKASAESHADVGDRANDAVRVNGNQLRCKIFGEGGNLGCTQLGRIEYAVGGGLINSDAIDNSAGVDCSDHEVNIKILLSDVMASTGMSLTERDALLAEMTDEVAELVLDDNRAQTLALAIARRQALPMVNVHARYLTVLESEGWLDRQLEFLPTDRQLAERQAAGLGLTMPEFAVLMAYTKTANAVEMERSDFPDSPYVLVELMRYFPDVLRRRYPQQIAGHRLRREIVAMQVSNQMVNMSGISFDNRMTEDTGAGVVDVMRAWLAARDIFDAVRLWTEVEALEMAIKPDVVRELLLELRRTVERGSLWLLRHRRSPLDVGVVVAEFRPAIRDLATTLEQHLRGRFRAELFANEASRLAAGVPEALAQRAVAWPLLHTAFDVVELAQRRGVGASKVAGNYWEIFDRLDLAWLWDAVGALSRSDRWQTQARAALRDGLLAAIANLTDDSLYLGSVDDWARANERAVNRTLGMFTEIRRADSFTLTNLTVALRQLENLALVTYRPST
jgi:glutamate dehydrogenase